MTGGKHAFDRVRVLLLDPFADERDMYSEYLRLVGFDVVVPPNPKAGLRTAAQHPPDVIVTHLRLADSSLNGIDVLKQVKGNRTTRHVRVVIITTSIQHSDARTAAAAHCDAYLLLPLGPDALAEAIHRLCRDKRTIPPRKTLPVRTRRNQTKY